MTDYDDLTALVLVDVQNDFADPAGGLYVPGGEELTPLLNGHLALARTAGASVVFTQDWHPEHTPHFEPDGGVWPVHCVAGTWGAKFAKGLAVSGTDPVVRKGTGGEDGYSGFSVRDPGTGETSSTRLYDLLRGRGVERVVVTGLAGDVCVAATALDAVRLGFRTVVPLALTRFVERSPGDTDQALADLAEAGVEVVAA